MSGKNLKLTAMEPAWWLNPQCFESADVMMKEHHHRVNVLISSAYLVAAERDVNIKSYKVKVKRVYSNAAEFGHVEFGHVLLTLTAVIE